jgi:hypothetical protein
MKCHEEEINMHLVGTGFVLQFEAHIFTLVHLKPHGAQTLCVKDTYVPPSHAPPPPPHFHRFVFTQLKVSFRAEHV